MDFQQAHRLWVEEALARESMRRDARWSEAIAVGSYDFVEKIKRDLGSKTAYLDVKDAGGAHTLRAQRGVYTSDFDTEK
jgi:putative transposase